MDSKTNILLYGLVFHSRDAEGLEPLRAFYQDLLGIEFKEEKHDNGPKHYAGLLEERLLLELYPPKKSNKTPAAPAIPDPGLIFNVSDLEATLEKMKKYTESKVEILPYGAKIHDPDGRSIYLHRIK